MACRAGLTCFAPSICGVARRDLQNRAGGAQHAHCHFDPKKLRFQVVARSSCALLLHPEEAVLPSRGEAPSHARGSTVSGMSFGARAGLPRQARCRQPDVRAVGAHRKKSRRRTLVWWLSRHKNPGQRSGVSGVMRSWPRLRSDPTITPISAHPFDGMRPGTHHARRVAAPFLCRTSNNVSWRCNPRASTSAQAASCTAAP